MNEQELIAEGYALTPQVVHTGTGDGKLYEKVITTVDGDTQVDVRKHKVVNPDGTVSDFTPNFGVAATPDPEVAPEVPVPVQSSVDSTAGAPSGDIASTTPTQ